MKVTMKLYEKEAIDYAISKFPSKSGRWAENTIAKDAFIEGYKRAKELIKWTQREDYYEYLEDFGQKEVEVEFNDGDHQL